MMRLLSARGRPAKPDPRERCDISAYPKELKLRSCQTEICRNVTRVVRAWLRAFVRFLDFFRGCRGLGGPARPAHTSVRAGVPRQRPATPRSRAACTQGRLPLIRAVLGAIPRLPCDPCGGSIERLCACQLRHYASARGHTAGDRPKADRVQGLARRLHMRDQRHAPIT